MEIIYREEQVGSIARKLNLSKSLVAGIINNYVSYLKDRIEEGKTVKFLNICYLRTNGELDNREEETMAYIATEIGGYLDVGGAITYRVLQCFEEQITNRLFEEKGYSVRGLVRIRLERTKDNSHRVRIKKSTVYNGKDVYIITLGSFKRKFATVT